MEVGENGSIEEYSNIPIVFFNKQNFINLGIDVFIINLRDFKKC
jgi:hypothetical protein